MAGTSLGGAMGSVAGSGGVSPSGGSTSGSDPDPSAFLMREDFESYSLGGLPTGGPWLAAEDCEQFSGQFSRTISADEVHGGTQALKLTNHHFPQCRLSANFGQASEYWVRAHIFYGAELDFGGKELLALDLLPAGGVGQDSMAVRFGSRTKEPCTEVGGPQITIIGIGGGEATGCADYAMPQGEWICFVAHVDQTSGLSVDTSINGQDHTFKSVGMEDRDRIAAFGDPGASVDHLRVGLFAHNSQATGSAYIDDLDVATQPLSCD